MNELRVLGFGHRVSGFGVRISGSEFRVSGSGFQDPDFGTRISGSTRGAIYSLPGRRRGQRNGGPLPQLRVDFQHRVILFVFAHLFPGPGLEISWETLLIYTLDSMKISEQHDLH